MGSSAPRWSATDTRSDIHFGLEQHAIRHHCEVSGVSEINVQALVPRDESDSK